MEETEETQTIDPIEQLQSKLTDEETERLTQIVQGEISDSTPEQLWDIVQSELDGTLSTVEETLRVKVQKAAEGERCRECGEVTTCIVGGSPYHPDCFRGNRFTGVEDSIPASGF